MSILQRRFTLIRRCALGVLISVPLFFAHGDKPQAALVVNFDASGVTSIDDLVVDGATYDISFENGVYESVFGTQLFTNAQAIVDNINLALNGESGTPLLSTSVTGAKQNQYFVPFELRFNIFGEVSGIDLGQGICSIPFAGQPCNSPWGSPGITGLSILTAKQWAVPTLVSTVPLPAALPLFGSALAMLGMVGWRRRRQAGA